MKAHDLRFLLSGTTLLLTLSGCARAPEPTAAEPTPPASLAGTARGFNVWLVSVDTVRADRLGIYGYERHPTSPRLDELLGQGWLFERATAPRTLTWPSLATVLTGLYPSSHGVLYNGYEFPPELPTLPRLLQEAGYRNGAFLSNMCEAGHSGWEVLRCAGGNDGKVYRQAVEWLDQLDEESPVFLWTHYFGAHGPYYNGGDLAETVLDPGYEGPIAPRKHALDRVMRDGVPLSPRDVQHLDALYDAAVIGTDGHVGRMLDALAERLDLSRTLIVFLSDHGEDLYDHNGYLYHACSVYQSSLHVPLGFVAPGLAMPPMRIGEAVELSDVLPTLTALLGLDAPEPLDGRSLLPLLEGSPPASSPRPVFSEYGETRIATVWEGDWKLVENPDRLTPVCFPGGPADLYPIGEIELYDLDSDPEEQNDLATVRPDVVERLGERLVAFRERRAATGPRERQSIDPELRDQLEALGYVVE